MDKWTILMTSLTRMSATVCSECPNKMIGTTLNQYGKITEFWNILKLPKTTFSVTSGTTYPKAQEKVVTLAADHVEEDHVL